MLLKRYEMQWRLCWWREKVGILVSKVTMPYLSCYGVMRIVVCHVEITKVISNHETLREAVENFGIPFEVVPVNKGQQSEAYAEIDELMQGNDLLVL